MNECCDDGARDGKPKYNRVNEATMQRAEASVRCLLSLVAGWLHDCQSIPGRPAHAAPTLLNNPLPSGPLRRPLHA